MKDVKWVKGLSSDFRKHHPRGALAIATTAVSLTFFSLVFIVSHFCKVERAIQLWADGRINIAAIHEAQKNGRAIQLVKKPNGRGQETAADIAFVKSKWMVSTCDWMERLEPMKVKKIEEIIRLAQEYMLKPSAAATKPNLPGNVHTNRPNPRIHLRDADDNDSDADDDSDGDGGSDNNDDGTTYKNQHPIKSQGRIQPQPQASNLRGA